MRKHIALPLAAALALASTAGFAALDGSHHDMTVFAGMTQLCWQCHGRNDANDATTMIPFVGNVGVLCLGRCHAGTGILGSTVNLLPAANDYPDYTGVSAATNNVATAAVGTVYFTSNHGADPSLLFDPYDEGLTVNVDISVSGYPYVGAAQMECSSCHSVHDNANSPFIWNALSDAANGYFCGKCHTGRDTNDLTGPPDGNHPVNMVVDSTAAAGRTLPAVMSTHHGRNPRRISIDTAAPGRYFDVASANGAALDAPTTHYTLGGKLSDFNNWAGAGSTQVLGCYTCHVVHGENQKNQLVVATYNQAADTVAATGMNPICMGCHGAAATVADNYAYNFEAAGNVGMTGFGHGVNGNTAQTAALTYTTSVGNFSFTIADPTATDARMALGSNAGEVMCSSCHDIHGGKTNTNILYQSAPAIMCVACHNGSGMPDVADFTEAGAGEGANVHHRTATKSWAANAVGTNDADTLNMGSPTWADAENWGDLSDGMSCSDCHIGNKTAHNW